jgi:uncharacterized protein
LALNWGEKSGTLQCQLTMKLNINREKLGQFCKQNGIARLELFGSALRDDFRNDSDVDLLCSLRSDTKCGLFEWAALKLDLEKFFDRPVDLVSRWGIEHSKNRYRKQAILSTAIPIYEEG